jgi:predicted amidophosphoribosyltransferase
MISALLRDLGASCVHLVWPSSCPVCGAVGVVACLECLVKTLDPPLDECLECGGRTPCPDHPNASFLRTGGVHEDLRRELVLRFKYGASRRLGVQMGRALALVFPRPDVDALVPIPLHVSSRRFYNQAFVLAKAMGDIWNLPVAPVLRWSAGCGAQTKKSSEQRRRLSPDSIRCVSACPGRVALVDDVCTTGSTLRCAAEAIRSSGGRVVGAITWSRSV